MRGNSTQTRWQHATPPHNGMTPHKMDHNATFVSVVLRVANVQKARPVRCLWNLAPHQHTPGMHTRRTSIRVWARRESPSTARPTMAGLVAATSKSACATPSWSSDHALITSWKSLGRRDRVTNEDAMWCKCSTGGWGIPEQQHTKDHHNATQHEWHRQHRHEHTRGCKCKCMRDSCLMPRAHLTPYCKHVRTHNTRTTHAHVPTPRGPYW